MRLIVGHNSYQQAGGEDFLFSNQIKILRRFGHDVFLYERHNHEIKSDILSRIHHLTHLRWSKRSFEDIQRLILSCEPQLAHFHNIFYVTTPSVIDACKQKGIPVIISLHNYRLMCVNGLFFRDQKPCEDCLGGYWTRGIMHKCYRDSYLMSALAGDVVQHHWKKKTWVNQVDQFIVATEFSRQKHIQAGIPLEKLSVLPHCVDDPGVMLPATKRGRYALYAGRLSEEKGVEFLIDAWSQMKDFPLYIMGTGPQKVKLEAYIQSKGLSHIKMLGFVKREEYMDIMRRASLLIAPSLCYDNFPMVVVEAYSYGVPVVASRIGTLEGSVEEGVTGFLFEINNREDLKAKCKAIIDDIKIHEDFCRNARKSYELKYTSQKNYEGLMNIYQKVLGS